MPDLAYWFTQPLLMQDAFLVSFATKNVNLRNYIFCS